jgi:predicted GNAT family acetyltransferase
MTENETSPEVVPQPDENRYSLQVDGREVGYAGYTDIDGQRVFWHTVVDPAEGGKGYGSTLIAGALTHVRDQGLRAVGVCPFVDAYVKKHHDFDDIVDPVSIELRARLEG